MIINKIKPHAQEPSIPSEGSIFFDIKACLDENEPVFCYNSLNKKVKVPIKKFNNTPSIQIYPQQKVLIPTGLSFNVPEGYIVKLYTNYNTSLNKGIRLINGIQVIEPGDNNHLEIALESSTEAVSLLQNEDIIASGCIEKTSYFIDVKPIDE